jgi:hypothetical protein
MQDEQLMKYGVPIAGGGGRGHLHWNAIWPLETVWNCLASDYGVLGACRIGSCWIMEGLLQVSPAAAAATTVAATVAR